jgi:hypothetical protein
MKSSARLRAILLVSSVPLVAYRVGNQEIAP